LLDALHGLGRGDSPEYTAAPTLAPRWVVKVRHTPRAPARELEGEGEEVAPSEQTLRLYSPAAARWLARLDGRALSYNLPAAAAVALTGLLGPSALPAVLPPAR
jgi:hypothetical protein